MLQRLKMQRKRFVILEPDIDTGSLQDNIPQKLKMHSYEALIHARLHASRLKGKYQFIFDLDYAAHFGKLEHMLTEGSLYYISAVEDIPDAGTVAPL
ncbi:hypothetical protein [Niabella hibiscisoli]|uniref:hypothetical protein n=1 Tax=Niabella hibiscisoli TaxID=1825928 RepID=UPI001F11394A|nr:hypothetical protein [Niabella hibiscisoli]MCH5719107.1 hypothetical protein [Niabella hibiscisoli]